MNSQNRLQQIEDESLIQKLFSKYLPYWPVFLGALVLGILVAFVYLKFATPVYEATATLIIRDEKKGNEESKLMESLNQISSKKIVENEIEVIQSRRIMEDVAKKLDLFTPVNEKESFKYRSAWFTSPIKVKSLQPELLKTKLNLPVSFDKNTKMVTFSGAQYPLNTPAQTPYGKLEFVANENFQPGEKEKDNKLFLSIYSVQDLIPSLLGNLKAEPSSKLSSIVNLSYRDQIPARAVDILNQLINSYRQSEIDEKNSLAKNTLNFVNERLGLVTQDLDSIQRKVQEYKSGSNAVDIGTQGQLFLQNVSANDQKLSEVNTQISILNQVEKLVKNTNSGGIVPSTLGVSDPLLTQLLDKLNTLELEYEKGKATIGENNPRLIEISDQINKIKPDILKNINSQQKSLAAMRDNIISTNSTYSSMLRSVPQKERELIDISRSEQNKRDIYDFLLQKKEESELAYASTIANNKVVDYAAAGNSPVSPKRKVIYLVSIFFFLAIPVGFLTVRESLSGKVMYRQEIEKYTDIPVIGEVAFNKTKKSIVIEPGKRSFIAEEFRKLRLSLSFLGINEKNKKILVTSSIPGEGKSFIASNLAISLSLTGKKVIIVDMDLNHPSQHRIFNVEKDAGVSDFLEGRKTAEEIIHPIPEFKNLYLITSGELPDDPTELFTNGRAEELINFLNERYDAVLVDTSPIVPVTDGYMLTHICDATLYVVRHQYTPRIFIKRIDANNNINPIHNPGIVFNGVKQRGFMANYYGYGYGYDYAHGNTKNRKRISVNP